MILDCFGNGAGTDLAGRAASGNVDPADYSIPPTRSRVLRQMRRSGSRSQISNREGWFPR